MSSLLQRRTPAQLLWIIGASIALFSIGFAVLVWCHAKLLQPTLWCSFATLIFSLVVCGVAEQVLRNGINSDRWPDSLLNAPRKLMAHPAFSVLSGLLLVGALAYVVFAVSGARHSGGIWVIL
jgi:hypothetical protein